MKELFEEHNIIKTGHFKLTSGRHSNQYINKDAIYSNPMLFNKVVQRMWDKVNMYKDTFDVITGPAIAGAVLVAPISLLLDKIFVYPEKIIYSELANDPNNGVIDTEIMKFRRGYNKMLKGKRVWITEDIITTGRSIENTIDAVEKCGGMVVGISAIWNRGLYEIADIPFLSLINERVVSYRPDECPNCKAGEILQDPKG